MNFSTIIAPSADMADKIAKVTNAFATTYSYYSITLYLLVSFYISTENLGTKAQKIIVIQVITICEKVSICKDFRSSILFDTTKRNTIFYFFRAGVYNTEAAEILLLLYNYPK